MSFPTLLDNDLYKFTMQQTALHLFPSTQVEYKLIIRTKGVDLRPLLDEIEGRIDELCSSRMSSSDLEFLGGIRFLKQDYVNFLEDFTLKRRFIDVAEGKDQLEIRVRGDWVSTILFEVPLLAIIEEVYCASMNPDFDPISVGMDNLNEKIKFAQSKKFIFTDFGTRRRFSRAWHQAVVESLGRKLPRDRFIGTSNLWLAKEYGLTPTGTMAHEFIQAGQGMSATQLVNSQKYMLEAWTREYRGDLGIALTDTIGIDAFLRDFDPYLAKLYDGVRHDSADPYSWGDKMIAHYEKFGIDPMTKKLMFSDNLNFVKADLIETYFTGRSQPRFGIGTFLTNDCGIEPLSIVMKLVKVNGNPVAKISDEPGKVICEDAAFLSYLRKVNQLDAGKPSVEDFLEAQQNTH